MARSSITYSALFLTICVSLLLLCTIVWMSDRFGDTTIDAIIFHYNHGLVGTPPKYYYSYAKRIFASIGGAFVVLVFVRVLTGRLQKRCIEKAAVCFSLCLLAASVALAAIRFKIPQYLLGTFKQNTFIESNYIAAESSVLFPEHKRNVIVIVMESMEKTFFEDFSPPLIPFLQNLAKDNLSCTLIEEKNLAWTTAGLTGLLLGVPLYTPTKNYYRPEDNQFLPGAESILTVFENNGYAINYISGTNVEFGGIKNIFTSHSQSPAIYDQSYFTEQGLAVSGKWGLKDLHLYQASKKLLTNIASEEQPFLAVVQTIDTHSVAKSFGDYPEPYNDDRDAFIAADHMIAEFLGWLEEQPFYTNTTVMIVGDHLYMNNFLGKQQLTQPRTIYNVFLNTVFDGEADVSQRKATMMDMGPSLLEAIGTELTQSSMALGRSVFSISTETLVEQYGLAQLTNNLSGYSEFYNKLFVTKKQPAVLSHQPADAVQLQ